MSDKATLQKALDSVHSVFAVTNCKAGPSCPGLRLETWFTNIWLDGLKDWESVDKAVEVRQGKNVADMSKEAGVQHLIWSSLPNITERKCLLCARFPYWSSNTFLSALSPLTSLSTKYPTESSEMCRTLMRKRRLRRISDLSTFQ
jgi:NmrA-like family